MNLHEYQAKSLLQAYNIPILRGAVAYTPREAQRAAVNLGGGTVVIKAQVHAGGRGKAGGVKLAKNPEEALAIAGKILGMKLVTPQTGAAGKLVRKVLVEEGVEIQREFYLSYIVDRSRACISAVISREGGTEIEEVAARHPEKVLTLPIPLDTGFQPFHSRLIAKFLGVSFAQLGALAPVLEGLYHATLGFDCSLLEINPLIETPQGEFICLDAKMAIDDNSLFRQPMLQGFLDYDEIDERELRAEAVGINYVALDGNIGCMVNGAGLAMATMDIIQQAGGKPANFLDVGGGADKVMVREAFKLILSDKTVKAVLVNIFGGIMRCDVIAEGIIAAARELSIGVPVVVRLSGTNVDVGKKLLAESGLKLISAENMEDAATKVVSAAKGG